LVCSHFQKMALHIWMNNQKKDFFSFTQSLPAKDLKVRYRHVSILLAPA
jgi:hypothetical protein